LRCKRGIAGKTGITQKVGAAKAALFWQKQGVYMKLQLTLEMLSGMLLTLLVVFFLLQSFVNAHALLAKTEYMLSRIAGTLNTYLPRLS
jgi:hypothetical protein